PDHARLLFDMSREAMERLRGRIARHGIQCDWRDGHAHVPPRPRQDRELRAGLVGMAERYDDPLERRARARLRRELASERSLGAVYDRASGHLHPLEYCLGLARAALAAGVRIYEQSPVVELVRGPKPVLRTARGQASGDFAVLCGNAWLRGIAPEVESRMMP